MELILEGDVDSLMLKTLIDAYNDLPSGDVLNIYFSSPGGNITTGEAIINLINRRANATTLTAFFGLESCAFNIFFKSKCYREILPSVIGMIHLTTWGGSIKEGLVTEPRTEFIKKEMKRSLAINTNFFRELGVSEEELLKYKKGEEVYFNDEQLKRMLKRAY